MPRAGRYTGVAIGLAWSVCGLLALHVGAYLKHALIDKDDVPRRMTPWPRPGPATIS